jgi:hypothetical protein
VRSDLEQSLFYIYPSRQKQSPPLNPQVYSYSWGPIRLIGDSAVPQVFTLQALVIPLLILSAVLHPYTIQGRTPATGPLDWRELDSQLLWRLLFWVSNLSLVPRTGCRHPVREAHI